MQSAFDFDSDAFLFDEAPGGLDALALLGSRPLSPDQFKTFSRCARKYQLQYIKRLNWPSDQRNFELGKNVHKLMEYQAKGLSLEHLLKDAPAGVANAWRKLAEHPASRWPIVASEWGFSIPLSIKASDFPNSGQEEKYWLSGRIDRIAWEEGSRTLWILDWKTGTAAPKKPESDWQTQIYLWAAIKAYGVLRQETTLYQNAPELQTLNLPENITPERIKFLYLEVSVKDENAPVREISVPFDATRLARFEQNILSRLGDIRNHVIDGNFPLPKQCPDPYCPYSNVCGIRDIQAVEFI